MQGPAFYLDDGKRRIVFQVWDGEDERRYTFHLYITRETSRKVQILKRAETMGDVLSPPNGCGKTLRVKYGPCNVVLRPVWNAFPWIARCNHYWIQADRVF